MKIGILTFYCSDNYGAMLQAYGLKHYVQSENSDTEIVPYAPPFLTGRHWFFPYYEFPSKRASILWSLTGLKHHLEMGRDFFRQKRNMKKFRKAYLLDGVKEFRTEKGLESLPYDMYIVGSDQIWNPDITFGLRKAYFGAFENLKKQKIIAYAASLGGSRLDKKYDEQMTHLLQEIDFISMREKTAVPYIKSLTQKEVTAVSDPVFFLDAKYWEKLEIAPKRKRYILVYVTERNSELKNYVKLLAEEKKLDVVEIKLQKGHDEESFLIDLCAGPAEFLGYIHHADYIVTNSFHAMAFSIIFHKAFLVFAHSNRNARLENVLEQCELQERMVLRDQVPVDIDYPVDWETVEVQKEQMAKESKDFLRKSLFSAE